MEAGGEEKKKSSHHCAKSHRDRLTLQLLYEIERKLWELAAAASQEQHAIPTLSRLESGVQIKCFAIRMLLIP